MKKLFALFGIAAALALAGAVPAGATAAKIHCVPWYCPPPLVR